VVTIPGSGRLRERSRLFPDPTGFRSRNSPIAPAHFPNSIEASGR
jgi:hypothetical protein